MINLLPPDIRNSLDFARKNTRMKNIIFRMLTVLVLIIFVVVVGLGILMQSSNNLAKQVESSKKQLQIQNQDKTEKEVADLSSTLNLVVQVLSKEILFSKLLKQIGTTTPRGSILTSLSINQFSGGLDLQAKASDYQTATQVHINLQDPKNLLFEKVDIVNVQCITTATSDPVATRYPCTIQMRALFAKDNPFLFISNKKVAS